MRIPPGALAPLLVAAVSCGPASTAPANIAAAPVPDAVRIEIGPGPIEATAADRSRVALCLGGDSPRIAVVGTAARSVASLLRPIAPGTRCESIVFAGSRICAASYDAGVGCVVEATGAVEAVEIPAPPTGLAWDGEALWIATDSGGLWRSAEAGPEQVLDLPDVMSGIVAGPFGVAWGTGGKYSWRTRILRRGDEQPEWVRPRPPPGIECAEEPEVCEWLTTAIGQRGSWIYFAAENAPAGLYRMWLPTGRFQEIQVAGDVLVASFGVVAADLDGRVWLLDENRPGPPPGFPDPTPPPEGPPPVFEDTGLRLDPGEVPVISDQGLWAAKDGRMRLVIDAAAPATARPGGES